IISSPSRSTSRDRPELARPSSPAVAPSAPNSFCGSLFGRPLKLVMLRTPARAKILYRRSISSVSHRSASSTFFTSVTTGNAKRQWQFVARFCFFPVSRLHQLAQGDRDFARVRDLDSYGIFARNRGQDIDAFRARGTRQIAF